MSKETVKIVIVGHVDHGKSTLIGRLLYETDSLPKEKIDEVKKISKELGKEAELAYLTDQLKEERERNITIDTAQIFFKTKKRDFVIIDTPGHIEFLKNMITGASLAEAGVLIVDVHEGIMEQTRRHAYLLSMLGMKNIIVIFNKMDKVNFDQNKYEQVRSDLLKFFKNINLEASYLIPASAREGENISERSSKMKWHKGPTLLRALDLIKIRSKTEKKPLRFAVQDIYDLNGENIIVGPVISGEIKKDQGIYILPEYEDAKIKKIKLFEKEKDSASAGENIGLLIDTNYKIYRGDIIVDKKFIEKPKDNFTGNLFWMAEEPLQTGKPFTIRCATQEIDCIAEKIEKRIDSSTLEVLEENAKELRQNETGIVQFRTSKPIVLEKFSFIEELGRFVIEKNFGLLGAGIIT